MCAKGQSLIDRGHFASKEIKTKIKQLQTNWIKLWEQSETRKERLKEAAQSLQVCENDELRKLFCVCVCMYEFAQKSDGKNELVY